MSAVANLAQLKAVYGSYSVGDPQPLFDSVSEDFELTEHAGGVPWSGKWAGTKGIQDFITAVRANITHSLYECEGMTAHCDEIAVSWGRFETTDNETGGKSARKWMHFIRFKDGKITEIEEFYDSLGVMQDLKRL